MNTIPIANAAGKAYSFRGSERLRRYLYLKVERMALICLQVLLMCLNLALFFKPALDLQ